MKKEKEKAQVKEGKGAYDPEWTPGPLRGSRFGYQKGQFKRIDEVRREKS